MMMVSTRSVVLVLLGAVLLTAEANSRRSYRGHQLVQITPSTKYHVSQLDALNSRHEGISFDDTPLAIGSPIDVLVAPHLTGVFWNVVDKGEMKVNIKHHDIQNHLDAEFERLDAKQAYDPNDYNTYSEIQAELVRLASACPDGFVCEIETIGLTTLGNEINQIKISQPSQPDKQVVWIDSLIHAREWIAGTSIMRVTARLIEEYGIVDEATELMDNYDFAILPVFNADGYIHSWENDRFWRKSRNENDGSNCIGTDLNRNHAIGWGELPGASTNPCSDVYMGSGASSEPEVQVVEDAMVQLAEDRDVVLMMSVHTAAEAWLMPFGYEVDGVCATPSDYDDLYEVGQAAVEAVANAGGDTWRVGGACVTLYAATGITCDFGYSGAGIKYSYTPELKGPSFDPDPSFIEPAFEEFFAGTVASLRKIEEIEGAKKH